MTKIIISLILFTSFLNAEHVRWHSSYDKAHQEALKSNKMLMVLLIEDNCLECNKMIRMTFQNQSYIKYINENFVSVIVSNGQTQSYPIEMLYTMVYPSVFFLNTQELFIGENIFGYVDSNVFEKHLKLYFK